MHHSKLLCDIFNENRFYIFNQPNEAGLAIKGEGLIESENSRNSFYEIDYAKGINHKFDYTTDVQKRRELLPQLE
jgi:hypothetical protein